MAYSTTGTSALRDAILRMRTPFVGARSFYQVINGNTSKIITDNWQNIFAFGAPLNNLPLWPFPYFLEYFFDKEPPFEIEKEILAGSWSEGLHMYGHSNLKIPDMDFMLVLKTISFSQDDQLSGKLTLKENTPFVHAYITDEDAVKLWKDFLADQDNERGKRLSSMKLKQRLNRNCSKGFPCLENDNLNVDDGAAINVNRILYHKPVLTLMDNIVGKGYFSDMKHAKNKLYKMKNFLRDIMTFAGWDLVLAISCEGWPSCAKEWITRARKWPPDELLHKITQDGYHIVPKKSPDGDFRLSFSFAETTLIENLTELQHKILRSFKAIVKYYQNSWSSHIKEVITSYHLKTIAFWHFERLTEDSITEHTVVNHLILLLQELAEALRSRELPMYFMPMVNLFKNVENPEEALDIGEKVEKLSHDLPRLIIGIENITTCFQRHSSLVKYFVEKIPNFKEKPHQKSNQSSAVQNLSKERMEKMSAYFDVTQDLGKCLNPMTNMHIPQQHRRQTVPQREEGPAITSAIMAILQSFQIDTEELTDI